MTIPEVPQHDPGSGVPNHGIPANAVVNEPSHRHAEAAPADHGLPPAMRPGRSAKPALFGVVGLVVGLLLGVVGTVSVNGMVQAANAAAVAEAEANKPKPLAAAVNKCKLSGKAISAKLGDDGHTLSLDGKGEDDANGLAWSDIECALEAVSVPDYVREQMGSTRALDGTQRESWDNFSASWSYHPDSGMNVVLRFTDV
ncbi:hypothetical protein ACFRJ9_11260 [Paenarthrobacter sp. NPDC056912]|uniref:hypothetical protein n=1 Tax=Paenarthrobacter sp. NPDC056912 TaxID=3345965 RepID=UPI00366B5C1E